MPAKLPPDTPRVTPHIFYDDVEAAIEWLVKAFGFRIRLRMTDDNGKVVHGDLEIDDDGLVMIGLAEENDAWECPRTLKGKITSRLYIYVDDVDGHCARAREAGATIFREPADQFYGDRVYECIDPEGHRWKFAQHLYEVDARNLKRPSP
jgi:uncharacterized glyoxalase superfamily protein PhnB